MKTLMKRSLTLALVLALALGLVGFSALADGTLIIGEVTVTSRYASNLRSGPGTNYPVVGNANPGQVFRTTGMSGDFYELLMPDNSTAYLHKNLGRYTAYPTPIPLGTQYTIPVYYRTSTGQNLLTTSQAVRIGQNTITANDALVPGYRLVSTRNVYVTVDATGRAFPNGVVFLYEHSYVPPVTPTPAPVQSYATVPVLYKNVYGQQLASEYRQLLPGTHLVQADSSRVPYGYVLSGVTDAVVFVSYAGVANPSSVSFVVIQQSYTPTPTPRPAVYATIPVIYRDGGSILYSTNQTLGEGYTTITANDSRVPSGYILTSARSVSVYVNASGVATPSSVTFTYRRPVTASIEVVYQDTGGNPFHTEPRTLSQGSNTITANDNMVPPGYVLQGQRSVVVTVNPDGSVSQSRVTFTYAPPAPPVTVNIPVIYKDHLGNQFYQTTVSVSSAAPNSVRADNSQAPANHVLTSPATVTVRVSSSGVATPAQVVFTYRDRATIVTIPAIDHYQPLRLEGSQPVYSGPGAHYYQASGAVVSGGRSRVYGSEGDWILMGYGLSDGRYRIGWVSKSALPAGASVPELAFAHQPAKAINLVRVYDDPIMKPTTVFEIQPGGTFQVLATQRDGYYAYIETEFNGQPYRGFVNQKNIQLQ